MLDPRLIEAISEVFSLPQDAVSSQSGRDTIPGWDSIGHLKLVLRLEEVFCLRFPAAQIPSLLSAGEIQEALNRIKP